MKCSIQPKIVKIKSSQHRLNDKYIFQLVPEPVSAPVTAPVSVLAPAPVLVPVHVPVPVHEIYAT